MQNPSRNTNGGTLPSSPTTPEHFERLRRHVDDDAMIESTGVIAFQNPSSKFKAASGVEPRGFWTRLRHPKVEPLERTEPG